MSNIAGLVAENLDIWTGAIERKGGAGRGGGKKRISLYGIERLRALILDLAVRGKLVPQDPKDQPASRLIAQISERRVELENGGMVRKSRVAADSSRIGPFEIPSLWSWTNVQSLARARMGKTILAKELTETGIPVFSAGMKNAPWGFIEDSDVIFSRGTIVISARGGIGFPKIPEFNQFVATQTTIACQTFDTSVAPYLCLALDSLPNWKDMTSQTAIPMITVKQVHAIQIPLPPIAEQQRIIDKVIELMALCDALERESADALAAHQTLVETLLGTLVNSADAAELASNWARLESHFDTLFTTESSIDALKQTVLDLAVRGKLVEQDAGDEPAANLLARARSCRTLNSKTGKAARGKSKDPANLPFSIPPSWEWSTFGELASDMRYGTSKKCDRDKNLTPVLRIPNVSGGTVNLSDMKYGPLDEKERADLSLRQGDILIIRSNGSLEIVGRFAIVPDLPCEAAFAGYLVRARLDQDFFFSKYIWYISNSAWIRNCIENPIRHGVGLKNLNLTELSSLQFPIPPLAEQFRIVAKVDELMTLCDVLKARITDAGETQRQLADAITQRAAA